VLPYPEREIVARDQLVGFWKNRFKHLERNIDLDQVSFRLVNDPNQATENSLNEIKNFNKIQYREFSKMGVYGVFNIPYYLDAIINSGNPVILFHFIKYYDKKKYREMKESSDFVVHIPKVSNMYKTKDDPTIPLAHYDADESFPHLRVYFRCTQRRKNPGCSSPALRISWCNLSSYPERVLC